jgi:hypothetical protein
MTKALQGLAIAIALIIAVAVLFALLPPPSWIR